MSKAAQKRPAPAQGEERSQLLLSFTLEGVRYELDLFNLRSGERQEIEQHASMPWARILRDGWLESETVLSYAAYLAVQRKGMTAITYEQLLDQLDENRVVVDLRLVRPGEGAAEGDEDGQRPTTTPQTTGSQN